MDVIKYALLCAALLCTGALQAQLTASTQDSIVIRSIYDEALGKGEGHENLHYLCKEIGARLSGSDELGEAIVWGESLLKTLNPDTVFKQPVMVPKWTRGDHESASFTSKGVTNRARITALGGSVGTNGTIQAKVIEVKQFEELEALGRAKIEGKIIFYNRPMDPLMINTGAAYGGAYDQRSKGATEAARYGAVGTLVRSLTHAQDTFPHTGAMNYLDDVIRIPAAAISTVDASALHNRLKNDPDLLFSMQLTCEAFEDVEQANVIAEIIGSEFPDEYILVGGHLDSWDIGEGAHDDGAGIVQSIEVLRILRALDYAPRHTIRVVLFVNEENGNNGGETYAKVAKENGQVHFAAIESDAGGFSPRGFNFEATDSAYAHYLTLAPVLEEYGVHMSRRGWSGVDIRPLKNDYVTLIGLIPDTQRYFDYHHSKRDVWENVNKRELELGAGAMTSLVYLLDQYRLGK